MKTHISLSRLCHSCYYPAVNTASRWGPGKVSLFSKWNAQKQSNSFNDRKPTVQHSLRLPAAPGTTGGSLLHWTTRGKNSEYMPLVILSIATGLVWRGEFYFSARSNQVLNFSEICDFCCYRHITHVNKTIWLFVLQAQHLINEENHGTLSQIISKHQLR